MTLSNVGLSELMAAGAHASAAAVMVASLLSTWAVWSLPVGAALLWVRGNRRLRVDVISVAASLAVAYAMMLAVRLCSCAWGIGDDGTDAFALCWDHTGLPDAQVVTWWTVALALLPLGRMAWMTFPILTAGLGVGWSLIYLGEALPLDVLGALPIAAAGALGAWGLRPTLVPAASRMLRRFAVAHGPTRPPAPHP